MSADDAWDLEARRSALAGEDGAIQNARWRAGLARQAQTLCPVCEQTKPCKCAVGASVEAEKRRAQFEAIERAAGASTSTMTIRVNPTETKANHLADMLRSSGLPACSLLVTNGYVSARIGDVIISVDKLRLFANDLANLVVDAERVEKAFGDRSPER